ncbi:sulfotransferase domain-containing protein [Emticicia sp. 21SJ11W-3]|uniref:sulfotransferase domain-containing protein n=1 Tax=Emticicia sp. 21SJ11W-3 TaxID=2916755 RepID=UPI0020A1D300|nr:sulfotransferase domain-containing protein [Emticicia sp. 21SJ11W-3]UTA68753.1 sulfotransferase domain-containing protein [Emticicia sp. 21SJ11W-3]
MIRTWDEHSYSWHKQKMLPVHFVKYEEMKLNPNKAFKEMINFLGLNFSDEAIALAISITDFKSLKKWRQRMASKKNWHLICHFFIPEKQIRVK